MVSSSTELLIRRLRWYQALASSPLDGVAVFAALFGDCKGDLGKEGMKCAEGDRVLVEEGANPWAIQFHNDMVKLGEVEDAGELFEEVGVNFLRFFREGWCRERFFAIGCHLAQGQRALD